MWKIVQQIIVVVCVAVCVAGPFVLAILMGWGVV